MAELSFRSSEVQRLRRVITDRRTRDSEDVFAIESARAIDGALDRGADIEAVYIDPSARESCAAVLSRLNDVRELRPGELARVISTKTPQPIVALVRRPHWTFNDLATTGIVMVGVGLSDPGNVGTLIRSVEASGGAGVVLCNQSADPFNPKAVRASAGAICTLPVVEGNTMAHTIEALRNQGRRCLGTSVKDSEQYDRVDLRGVAVFMGSEAHGLDQSAPLDAWIHIPMAKPAESLNTSVAAAVIAYEAARQGRA